MLSIKELNRGETTEIIKNYSSPVQKQKIACDFWSTSEKVYPEQNEM